MLARTRQVRIRALVSCLVAATLLAVAAHVGPRIADYYTICRLLESIGPNNESAHTIRALNELERRIESLDNSTLRKVVEALIAALDTPDRSVRVRVCEALQCCLSRPVPSVLSEDAVHKIMQNCYADPDSDCKARLASILFDVLVGLELDDHAARMLGENDPLLLWGTIAEVSRLYGDKINVRRLGNAPAILARLKTIIEGPEIDVATRLMAADAFLTISPESVYPMRVVESYLYDPLNAGAAALMLGRYGKRSISSIPVLLRVIETWDIDTTMNIIQAIGQIGVCDSRVETVLVKFLAHPIEEVRIYAVQALGELRVNSRAVIEALVAIQGAEAQRYAAQVLRKIARESDEAK